MKRIKVNLKAKRREKYSFIKMSSDVTLSQEEIDEMIEQALKERDEEIIEILKDSLGYHCDTPDCDHNLKEGIKVLERMT